MGGPSGDGRGDTRNVERNKGLPHHDRIRWFRRHVALRGVQWPRPSTAESMLAHFYVFHGVPFRYCVRVADAFAEDRHIITLIIAHNCVQKTRGRRWGGGKQRAPEKEEKRGQRGS